MSRFGSKKDIEAFSNSLQKLSNDLNSITNNVDNINNQFDDYNVQINDIKDNVISLENELQSFIHEVKISPIIENAKKQIIKNKEIIEKEYNVHQLIRERLLNIIKNPNDKNFLIKEDEKKHFTIPDFYLSYILIGISDFFKKSKEANSNIKQALLLNYEKTSLILMILYININNDKEALKWLSNYLNKINPKKTDTTLVKLIEYFNDNQVFLNLILDKLNQWNIEINNDNELHNNIIRDWDNTFNNNSNIDDYIYVYKNCENYESLINDLKHSNLYTNIYNKLNSFIKNSNDTTKIDLLCDIIYSYEGKELELKDEILKNELIIKNNGANKEIKHIKDKNIFNIFLLCFNNNKYSKKSKEIMLKYSIPYISELLNEINIENKEVIININNWKNTTLNGSNERELIDSITEYLNKSYLEEINNYSYINFKTLYSISFVILGIIVLLFNVTIATSMICVGVFMFTYFIYNISNSKKNIRKQYDEVIYNNKQELYNSIAEIVDIKLIINNNLDNKNKLVSYMNNLKEIK